MIRDVRIYARTPGVRILLGKRGKEYGRIEESLQKSELVDDASFITAGGDYHHSSNIERAYVVVHVAGKKKSQVKTNAAGGFAIMEASSPAADVRLQDMSDEDMIEAIREGKSTTELRLRPLEEGNIKLLLHNTLVLAREVAMRRREKALVSPQDM